MPITSAPREQSPQPDSRKRLDISKELNTLKKEIPNPTPLDALKEQRAEVVKKMKLGEFLTRSAEEKLTDITTPPLLPSALEENSKLTFDFHGNRVLEQQISLADVMPPQVRAITITEEGKEVSGKRRGISGEFFTAKNQRLEIFTRTRATVNQMDTDIAQVDDSAVNSFNPKTGEEHDLIKQSLEKGIDPTLLLNLYRAQQENQGKLYADAAQGIDSFEMQLAMILKVIGRYEGDFAREYPDIEFRDGAGKYSAEFISYFLENYAQNQGVEDREEFYAQFSKAYAPNDPDFFRNGKANLEKKMEERRKEFIKGVLPEIENLNTDQRREYFQALNAREVWDLRRSLGPRNLRNLFQEIGLDDVQFSQSEIFEMAQKAVKQEIITGNTEADAQILTKIIWHESIGGKVFAVSPTGALGLGQMIADNYLQRWNFNPFNPQEAVLHAARHLQEDYPRLGNDMAKTIAAYNNGSGAIADAVERATAAGNPENWEQYLPRAEGRNYRQKVLAVDLGNR